MSEKDEIIRELRLYIETLEWYIEQLHCANCDEPVTHCVCGEEET